MKTLLWLTGIAMAVSGVGQAAVMPCVSGSYASFIAIAGTGCSVDGELFSGFSTLPVPVGSTPLPSSITVSPITAASAPGLLFTLNATATARQTLEAFLAFNVTPLPGGNSIAGTLLTQNGGTATGDGGVVGIESVCLGAAFTAAGTCPGTPASRNLGTFALSGIPPQTSDSLTFPPRSLVGITGDFSLTGGTNGTAAVTSFGIQVNATGPASAVPEPATLFITGSGLLGLAIMRRKRKVVLQ